MHSGLTGVISRQVFARCDEGVSRERVAQQCSQVGYSGGQLPKCFGVTALGSKTEINDVAVTDDITFPLESDFAMVATR